MLLGIYALGDPAVGDAPPNTINPPPVPQGDVIPLTTVAPALFWPLGWKSFSPQRAIMYGATVLYEVGFSLVGFGAFNLLLTGPQAQSYIGNPDWAYLGQIDVLTDIGGMSARTYVVYPLPPAVLKRGIWSAVLTFARLPGGTPLFTVPTCFVV